VAAEAGVEGFWGAQLGEGDDCRLSAACLDMRLAWAMTALAAGVFRRFPAGGDALVMGISVKSRPDVRVTGFANIAAHIISGQRSRWRKRNENEHRPKRAHALTIPNGVETSLVEKNPDAKKLEPAGNEILETYFRF